MNSGAFAPELVRFLFAMRPSDLNTIYRSLSASVCRLSFNKALTLIASAEYDEIETYPLTKTNLMNVTFSVFYCLWQNRPNAVVCFHQACSSFLVVQYKYEIILVGLTVHDYHVGCFVWLFDRHSVKTCILQRCLKWA